MSGRGTRIIPQVTSTHVNACTLKLYLSVPAGVPLIRVWKRIEASSTSINRTFLYFLYNNNLYKIFILLMKENCICFTSIKSFFVARISKRKCNRRFLHRPINRQVIRLRGPADLAWFPLSVSLSFLMKVPWKYQNPFLSLIYFVNCITSTVGSRMYISLMDSVPRSLGLNDIRYPRNSPWIVSYAGGRQLICRALDDVLCAVVIVGFPDGAETKRKIYLEL